MRPAASPRPGTSSERRQNSEACGASRTPTRARPPDCKTGTVFGAPPLLSRGIGQIRGCDARCICDGITVPARLNGATRGTQGRQCAARGCELPAELPTFQGLTNTSYGDRDRSEVRIRLAASTARPVTTGECRQNSERGGLEP